MSTITELRTICDIDHGESVSFATDKCLRCTKDLCALHLCFLTVTDLHNGWGSKSIATFCRPCADLTVDWAKSGGLVNLRAPINEVKHDA